MKMKILSKTHKLVKKLAKLFQREIEICIIACTIAASVAVFFISRFYLNWSEKDSIFATVVAFAVVIFAGSVPLVLEFGRKSNDSRQSLDDSGILSIEGETHSREELALLSLPVDGESME